MLGRGLGGIERSACDYATSLQESGGAMNCDVLFITHPNAAINATITHHEYALTHLKQLGSWDVMAAKRLQQIIQRFGADFIITHGNRALQLSAKAKLPDVKIIATSHNYNMQHLKLADGVFCITQHMLQQLRTTAPIFNERNSFHIPNMLPNLQKYQHKHWHNPIRIGAIGRMVEKKGFDVLIKAIARLREKLPETPFELWIAGDGEERAKLEKISKELRLENIINFCGWVNNAADFYAQIDIFCMPSLDEPFGIVLLEAMNAGLPIIATKTIGPSEIILHNQTGVLVEIGDAEAICTALLSMIENRNEAQQMAKTAYDEVNKHYNKQIIANKIINALRQLKPQ